MLDPVCHACASARAAKLVARADGRLMVRSAPAGTVANPDGCTPGGPALEVKYVRVQKRLVSQAANDLLGDAPGLERTAVIEALVEHVKGVLPRIYNSRRSHPPEIGRQHRGKIGASHARTRMVEQGLQLAQFLQDFGERFRLVGVCG